MRSNHERIATAFDLLVRGVQPFVEAELKSAYGDRWTNAARTSFRDRDGTGALKWDAHSVLTVMWDQWNSVFRRRLSHGDRSLVSELREFRNRWAHQGQFDFDDAYRVLDSVHRLLKSARVAEAAHLEREKLDLMNSEFNHRLDVLARESKLRMRRWRNASLYAFCCATIVYALWQEFHEASAIFICITMGVFAYMITQAFKERPILAGPHECFRCGRIIYSDPCPYCEVKHVDSEMPVTESESASTPFTNAPIHHHQSR
ncbi:MAG: Swt1 family HEPN domain-containing protein [Planctomycetota bacterium]|nr:Swt1 family HEPN domain-containing protein [Planctomycetota bacterium]